MDAWVKGGLAVAGGFIALKIWNDSKALSQALADKANTASAGNYVAGRSLPNPTWDPRPGDTTSRPSPLVPNEGALPEANPSTDYYDKSFFGVS